MTKAFFISFLQFTFLFHASSTFACNAPAKPAKVSKNAIWVGGCDGGVWIEIQSLEKSRAKLSIFDDYEGKLLKNTWFAFSPGCEAQNKAELEKTFDAYDGELVLLKKREPSKPDQMCGMKPIK